MSTSTQIPLCDRGAFKIKEAAVYLGVSVVQVRRYIQRRRNRRLPLLPDPSCLPDRRQRLLGHRTDGRDKRRLGERHQRLGSAVGSGHLQQRGQ